MSLLNNHKLFIWFYNGGSNVGSKSYFPKILIMYNLVNDDLLTE